MEKGETFLKIFFFQYNSILTQKVSNCCNTIQIQLFNKNMFPSNFDARVIPYRNIKKCIYYYTTSSYLLFIKHIKEKKPPAKICCFFEHCRIEKHNLRRCCFFQNHYHCLV